MTHGRALALLIGLMIVWGSTYIVTKEAVEEIPPLLMALLRFIAAAVILVPLAFLRGGVRLLPKPLPIVTLLLMGFCGVTLYYGGFNLALLYGSATQGALVQALIPAAVAFAAVSFLHEKPSRRRVLGIVLSIAGVVLVILGGSQGSDESAPRPLLGALIMFSTVVAWTVYTVLAKRLIHVDQLTVIAIVTVVGTVFMLPLVMIEMQGQPWPAISLKAWGAILYLGVVASAAGFLIYNRALRDLDASEVAVYINLIPIVGVVTAVIFLGEAMHPLQIAGGVIAVAGMWLSS